MLTASGTSGRTEAPSTVITTVSRSGSRSPATPATIVTARCTSSGPVQHVQVRAELAELHPGARERGRGPSPEVVHPACAGRGVRVDREDPRALSLLGALQVDPGERRTGTVAGRRCEHEHHEQDAQADDRPTDHGADHRSSSTTRKRAGVSTPDSAFIHKKPPAKQATTTSSTT